MSYTKKTWHDGDVITAAALNNIENQTAQNEPLYVPFTVGESGDTVSTTAVFSEVKAAYLSGRSLIAEVSAESLLFMAPLVAVSAPADPDSFNFAIEVDTSESEEESNAAMYQIGFSANAAVIRVLPRT